LVGPSDLLWASSRDLGSRARPGTPKGVVEKARAALPSALADSCMRPIASVVRPTGSTTFVNLVCEAPEGPLSLLLAVPRAGAARLVLADIGEEGRLSLLEVLEGRDSQTLALARELPGGKRTVELWSAQGTTANRLATWEH